MSRRIFAYCVFASFLMLLLMGCDVSQDDLALEPTVVARKAAASTALLIQTGTVEVGYPELDFAPAAFQQMIRRALDVPDGTSLEDVTGMMDEATRNEVTQKLLGVMTEALTHDANSIEDCGMNNLLVTDDVRMEREIEEVVWTGSGVIVTATGHLVTNAHVVESDKEEFVEKALLKCEAPEKAAQRLLSAITAGFEKAGLPLDEDQSSELSEEVAELFAVFTDGELKGCRIEAIVPTSYGRTKVSCEVLRTGNVEDGHDVAVLKADGHGFTPLMLSPEAPAVGEPLYLTGYSSEAFSDLFGGTDVPDPTFSQGTICAVRTREGGAPVLQTDARMIQGNSGGPAVNSQGEIMGIASFTLSEDDAPDSNFVVPVSVIKELMASAKVAVPAGGNTGSKETDLWKSIWKEIKRTDWLGTADRIVASVLHQVKKHPSISFLVGLFLVVGLLRTRRRP